MSEEKVYIIPLRREWLKQTRVKRAPRAIRAIRAFLERHVKAKEVKVDPALNEIIWQRGAKKPPAKIKVKVEIKDDVATAKPFEIQGKVEKKVEEQAERKPAEKAAESVSADRKDSPDKAKAGT